MPDSAQVGRDHELRQALAMTAAALLIVAAASRREDDTIRFTGKWAHLGKHSIREILDRANAVLGATQSDLPLFAAE